MLFSPPTEFGRKVRQQLRDSDLAARLASPDLLPDPMEYAHPLLQSFFRGTLPKNYEGLLERLVEDLDWYLQPRGGPPLPASVAAQMSVQLGTATTLSLIGGFVAAILLGQWYGVPFFAIAGGALMLNGVVLSRRQIDPGRKYEAAMELYHYLVESYSDPEEEAGESVELMTAELESDDRVNAAARREGH